ncbi:MAG: hypothetical protein GF317_02365 [Candidatus Lokiarchaeota archaeon]|nr:hypothetical protein [Candidatus Lokiarchaeota archaeon]
MIKAIVSFKFILNQKESGEINPEFKPLQLEFADEGYNSKNLSKLIVENDIYAVFYQQTTGLFGVKYGWSNFFTGRLKETPYQVISYFKQIPDGSQYLVLSIFEYDDEIELYNDLIRDMGDRLDKILDKLAEAEKSKKLSKITNINIRLKNELKYTIFQVERLSNLDNLQKIALIYNSELRLAILKLLREYPHSKVDLKEIIQELNPTANIEALIQPFLELNLVRRDWIQGEKDKETGIIKNQGEFLFLVKDIMLARFPNQQLLNHFKDTDNDLFPIYQQKVYEFFSQYDPYKEPEEKTRELANILLNPDVYDFFVLMKNNYYPKDKIPKIFSEFAVTDVLLDSLKEMNIITELEDYEGREWILLLTDVKPLVIFPEYILPKIRENYIEGEKVDKINYEVAKKAYDLLELTYPEKVGF